MVLLFRALYDWRHQQAQRALLRYRDTIGKAQLAIHRELIARSIRDEQNPAAPHRLEETRPVRGASRLTDFAVSRSGMFKGLIPAASLGITAAALGITAALLITALRSLG